MIFNLAFIFVFLIEMIIATLFFSTISERKTSIIKTFFVGTLIFQVGAIINIFVVNAVWFNVLFSVIATCLFSFFLFKIKLSRAMFYSLLLVAISTFIEFILIFLSSALTENYVKNYQSDIINIVVSVIISKMLYFLIAMIIVRLADKNVSQTKIPLTFYIFPLVTNFSIVAFWYISLTEFIEYRNQIILAVVSALLLFATIFMFFAFQLNAQRETKLMILQQEQDKLKTDMMYYDILEKQNQNLMLYAHDTQNHLTTIKNLNKNPQIDAYISEMFERLSDYSNVSHSGNRILDVIIDKYITECNIKKISFCFDVKNNNLSTLNYYDVVAILGNLLDNAVEAAGKSIQKTVAFETNYRNRFSDYLLCPISK